MDPTEMTGLETYVHQCVRNDLVQWYPHKKAHGISGRTKVKKDFPSLFLKINKLEKRLEASEEKKRAMMESIGRMAAKMEDISEPLQQINDKIEKKE
jgi:hypothetical protein